MKRNEMVTWLVTLTAAILLLLLIIEDCQAAGPSTKSVASSLLRRRGNKSKSSSSSSSSAICMLPPVTPGSATCFASFRRWTYSAQKGKCEEIYYGGCFGTKNLFDSFDDCRKACGGGRA